MMMFAVREVVQEHLGFSPSELVLVDFVRGRPQFGRDSEMLTQLDTYLGHLPDAQH